jgi:DNA-binding Lrp family transcriptional regulator
MGQKFPAKRNVGAPPKAKGNHADNGENPVSQSGDNYILDETDHKLLKHIIEFPQTSFKELGKIIGMSANGVRKRYKKPAFQKALEDIKSETWDLIRRAQNLAARRLMKLVQDSDKKVALRACELIMQPLLSKAEVEIKNVQEVIYRTRFGEQGQLISEKEEIEAETPKNTLELLGKKA